MTTRDPLEVAADHLDAPHLWLDHLRGYLARVADAADRAGRIGILDDTRQAVADAAALPDDLEDVEAVDEALDRLRSWWHDVAPFHLASLQLLEESIDGGDHA